MASTCSRSATRATATSSVQDLAENHLDGVFYGSFPSGNGINGSDFIAELQAYHDKVFAPQTIIGTAAASNGGVGGVRVAAVHSGIWVPAIPVGGSPIFSTTTSPSNGADPKHLRGTRTAIAHKAVTRTKLAKPAATAKSHAVKTAVHDAAVNAIVDQTKPRRLHK